MVAWPVQVLQILTVYVWYFFSFSVSSCLAVMFSIPSHPDFGEPSYHCFYVSFFLSPNHFFLHLQLGCVLPEGTPLFLSQERI